MTNGEAVMIEEPRIARLLFADTRFAWLWLPLRLYLGWAWWEAVWHKFVDPKWIDGGQALVEFWQRGLKLTPKPVIAFDWYRSFIEFLVNSAAHSWLSKVVIFGELAIALGLILGAFTGLAALIEVAAKALRVAVQASAVREPKDFDGVFSEMIRKRPDALFVIADPLTRLNRKQLLELATKSRLPAMYENSPYVDDGGLMAYGPSQAENLQIALHHVDKILKGTKVSELPIEQPTKFELVINLKTAKQIGVTIPQRVLARAERVI